jgi:hypothetical protein
MWLCLEDQPSVRCKLENLAKLFAERRAQLLNGLNQALEVKE